MTRELISVLLASSSALLSIGAQAAPSQVGVEEWQQVLAVTRDWTEAENSHDAAKLRRILDDKFISTFAANKPIGKDAFIKGIMAGKLDPTQSQSLTDQSVVVDGDVAVTVGTDTFHSATKPPLALRYTLTYIHRDGRWQALAEHIVAIPPAK